MRTCFMRLSDGEPNLCLFFRVRVQSLKAKQILRKENLAKAVFTGGGGSWGKGIGEFGDLSREQTLGYGWSLEKWRHLG